MVRTGPFYFFYHQPPFIVNNDLKDGQTQNSVACLQGVQVLMHVSTFGLCPFLTGGQLERQTQAYAFGTCPGLLFSKESTVAKAIFT